MDVSSHGERQITTVMARLVIMMQLFFILYLVMRVMEVVYLSQVLGVIVLIAVQERIHVRLSKELDLLQIKLLD